MARLHGLVVTGEIQHLPALPELSSVLMDRPDREGKNGHFLLLGTAEQRVMYKSKSLLGCVASLEVSGFDLSETGTAAKNTETVWLRGGFPGAYLAPDDAISIQPGKRS